MNNKQISKLSLIIIFFSLICFLIFYQSPFEEIPINELLQEEGKTGLVFGRVEKILSNDNKTLFILTNGASITVFYPKEILIKKNDFVYVYGQAQQYQNKLEIYAYKVRKDV